MLDSLWGYLSDLALVWMLDSSWGRLSDLASELPSGLVSQPSGCKSVPVCTYKSAWQ
jgi:hypothetical protein